MNDHYSHHDMNIIYVAENIPGPAEDTLEYEILLGNYNSQMLDNCLCRNMCVRLVCKCLQTSHGDNYEMFIIDGVVNFRIGYKPCVFRHYPIIECNSNCQCLATCGNRVVQNGPLQCLIVKPCEDKEKGLGLFTTNFIYKGTFICEYAGELLTRSQALQRSEENDAQGKMNYIFCLNEHTTEGMIQTFVDPSKFGNIGRYINHSCDPISSIVPVRSESAIPHLALFARRDIQPGEEITFDYGSRSVAGPNDHLDPNRKPCLCKADSCTGFLPFENFD